MKADFKKSSIFASRFSLNNMINNYIKEYKKILKKKLFFLKNLISKKNFIYYP